MGANWVVCSTAVTFGRSAKEPVQRLESAGCEVRLNPYGRPLDKKEMYEFARDADAIILGNDDLPASVIKRLKKLKIIARYGVGFDGVDISEARERGIEVTYAPAANREETADLTLRGTSLRWLSTLELGYGTNVLEPAYTARQSAL